MKMTMHIDEDVLAEVMKVTGASSKTKAVALALGEIARKAKLKALLNRGLGLSTDELKKVFPPLATYDHAFAVAEEPPPPPPRHEHRRSR